MRLLLATLLLAAVAALSAGSASAAPAHTAKLTPNEAKWATKVVVVWNRMNGSLQLIGKQVVADQALIPGTKTNLALVKTLALLYDCSTFMKRTGAAPTGRLRTVGTTMGKACTQFRAGALGVARGISTIGKNKAKLGAAQINDAFVVFKTGSTFLARARTQLIRAGSTSLFSN
jgi:hypothetical protein